MKYILLLLGTIVALSLWIVQVGKVPEVNATYLVIDKNQIIGEAWAFSYTLENGCILRGDYELGQSVTVNKITCEVI